MFKKLLFLIMLCTLHITHYTVINADSWSEKPDYNFYVHPLLEISEAKDRFLLGKIIGRVKKEKQAEILKVKLITGIYSGRIVDAENFGERFLIDTEINKRVLLDCDKNTGRISVVDYDRTPQIWVLIFLFVIVVLIVGGIKKIIGLITLALGIIFLIFVFIPLILKGWNPLFLALLSILLITTSIIFGACKFSKKSVAAITGTLLSVVFVLALGLIFYPLAHINGFSLEPVQMLNYFSKNYSSQPFNNFQELLLSVLIIGACGVIIDVAICIASSMEQIVLRNPGIQRKELIKLGMDTGRNIAATASNTLILAYFGAGLVIILAATISIRSFTHLFNNEWFFITVFQALAGSIGFLVAVPLTTVISGFLMVKK